MREAKVWVTDKSPDLAGSKEYVLEDALGKFHWLVKTPPSEKANRQIRVIGKFQDTVPAVLYGGNEFPVLDEDHLDDDGKTLYEAGDVKPFDLLAKGESLSRLGILRMDVDNLGAILSEKAAAKYGLNFARYAAISRNLDWFFKGYLNTLHKNYQKDTLIIYSGGDDLFIIGRWREVLEFAGEIRSEFKRWTCDNPMLSISGGMSIVPGKFPVMQATKMAAKAEDAAKDHSLPERPRTKNSFTLFDVPLHWEEEFPIVESLKNEMLEHYRSGRLTTRSFLMKVTSHALSRQFTEKNKMTPRWRWVMAYDLSRYRDTVKDPTAHAFVERIMQDAFRNNVHKGKQFKSHYHYLDLLLVAARWTELQLRTEGKQ